MTVMFTKSPLSPHLCAQWRALGLIILVPPPLRNSHNANLAIKWQRLKKSLSQKILFHVSLFIMIWPFQQQHSMLRSRWNSRNQIVLVMQCLILKNKLNLVVWCWSLLTSKLPQLVVMPGSLLSSQVFTWASNNSSLTPHRAQHRNTASHKLCS